MKLRWVKNTSRVTYNNNVWRLPGCFRKTNGEELWSEEIPVPKKTVLKIAVNKKTVSPYPFTEFAIFLVDDWVTWNGKEQGFRWPMHREESSSYVQHPFTGNCSKIKNKVLRELCKPLSWFEKYFMLKNLTVPKIYTIEFFPILFSNLKRIQFKVNGETKHLATGYFPSKKIRVLLVSHNNEVDDEQVEGFYLDLYDAEIFY